MDHNYDILTETLSYPTLDSFNCELDCAGDLFILHQNIRSFNANCDMLNDFLDRLKVKPHVLVLTETWFTHDTYSEIDNYESFHVSRQSKAGGGVSIYVDTKLCSSLVDDYCICNSDIEMCLVGVSLSGRSKLNVLGIYRPPGGNLDNFSSVLFDNVLSTISPMTASAVCGDLNVDLINLSASTVNIIENFRSLSYVPLITNVTRPAFAGGTCIDHIWINQFSGTKSGVIEIDITDHFPVFALIKCNLPTRTPTLKSFRDHSRIRLNRLKNESRIALAPLYDSEITDINSSVECFTDILRSSYKKCCPHRTKQVTEKRLRNPWLTDSLLFDIDRKHALFRDYKRGNINFESYRYYRNYINSRVRFSRKQYYHNKFVECSGNSKAVWSTVRSLMGSKTNPRNKAPNIDEFPQLDVTSNVDLANGFNRYFSSIGTRLTESHPRTSNPMEFMSPWLNESFFVDPCEVGEVVKIISSLSNRCSTSDYVPVFIFKYLNEEISPIICKLFNLSVQVGVFPSSLKIARVTPVFKSGDKSLFSNYRPISILGVLSKVFEKLMFRRFNSFLERFHVLGNNQFGFRKSRSTSDAVLQFLSDSYDCLEKREHLLSVCLDFSKAFDTIDHGVLLGKLSRIGVRGVALDWFESYMSERAQYVSVSGGLSSTVQILTGVPQGTVLGPILFNIYINDMSNICPELKCIHYADDTTIYVAGPNVRQLAEQMNSGFLLISEWLSGNRLILNGSKTKSLLISNTRSGADLPPILIGGSVIANADSLKFLGVHIDAKLKFKDHVDMVCSKMSRSIGIIRRISYYATDTVLVKLYFSLVYSQMVYGILAWGNSSIGNVNRVKQLQTRFFKLLSRRGSQNPTIDFSLMSFETMYNFMSCLKLYQCFINNYHEYFNVIFSNHTPDHHYHTRFSNNNITVPIHRLKSTHNSFVISSINQWNSLPVHIKAINNYNSFKRVLKCHFLQPDND